MAKSGPVHFDRPWREVFAAIVAAMPGLGLTPIRVDEAAGIITAKTAMSLVSWGENVVVRLHADDEHHTTMIMYSQLRFQLVGWGKNAWNFTRIERAVRSILSGRTAGTKDYGIM